MLTSLPSRKFDPWFVWFSPLCSITANCNSQEQIQREFLFCPTFPFPSYLWLHSFSDIFGDQRPSKTYLSSSSVRRHGSDEQPIPFLWSLTQELPDLLYTANQVTSYSAHTTMRDARISASYPISGSVVCTMFGINVQNFDASGKRDSGCPLPPFDGRCVLRYLRCLVNV